MKTHVRNLILLTAGVAGLSCAAMAAPPPAGVTGLKPGVSTVDAFMGREPAPPKSGEDSIHIEPLVDALGTQLGKEDDFLSKHSDNASAQGFPGGDPNNMSMAQRMAMARSMTQNGGMQVMMLMQKRMTDSPHTSHVQLWTQRVQQANTAIAKAESWVEKARGELDKKSQATENNCPMRTYGELKERDPSCVNTERQSHEQKVHQLAVTYLDRVGPSMSAVFTMTKVIADEDAEFAKKLEATGNGSMAKSMAYAAEGEAIQQISKYNELLGNIVGTTAALAKFKAQLVYND